MVFVGLARLRESSEHLSLLSIVAPHLKFSAHPFPFLDIKLGAEYMNYLDLYLLSRLSVLFLPMITSRYSIGRRAALRLASLTLSAGGGSPR